MPVLLKSAPTSETPSLLDGMISEHDLAKELKVCLRTVISMRERKEGPPFIRIARRIYYRREKVAEWLLSREAAE